MRTLNPASEADTGLAPLPSPGSDGGVSDHGLLDGLLDDDHPQYAKVEALDALRSTGRYLIFNTAGPQIEGVRYNNEADLKAALAEAPYGTLVALEQAATISGAWDLRLGGFTNITNTGDVRLTLADGCTLSNPGQFLGSYRVQFLSESNDPVLGLVDQELCLIYGCSLSARYAPMLTMESTADGLAAGTPAVLSMFNSWLLRPSGIGLDGDEHEVIEVIGDGPGIVGAPWGALVAASGTIRGAFALLAPGGGDYVIGEQLNLGTLVINRGVKAYAIDYGGTPLNEALDAIPFTIATEEDRATAAEAVLAAADAVISDALDALSSGLDSEEADRVAAIVQVGVNLTNAINSLRTEILDGAPDALNTLSELAARAEELDTDLVAVLTDLGGKVDTDDARLAPDPTAVGDGRTIVTESGLYVIKTQAQMRALLGVDASGAAIPESQVTGLVADLGARVLATRLVSSGTGLLGGGSLAADRTLVPDFGTGAGKVVEGNAVELTNARTPTDGSVTTAKLVDDAVTYAKLQNASATFRLLGRITAGAGDYEELTPAQSRSLLGVSATPASALYPSLAAGQYLTPYLGTARDTALTFGTTTANATGVILLAPIFVPYDCNVDEISLNLATAATDAGALLELAFGHMSGANWVLNWSAGTVAITGSTGLKQITVARALTAGYWYVAAKIVAATTAGTNPVFTGTRVPSAGVAGGSTYLTTSTWGAVFRSSSGLASSASIATRAAALDGSGTPVVPMVGMRIA